MQNVRVRLNLGKFAHVRAAENWNVRVCVRAAKTPLQLTLWF